MTVPTLLLSPEQEGYSVEFQPFNTGVRFDSPSYVMGVGYRKQTVKVPLTIIAGEDEQIAYLRAFFDTGIRRGSMPFYVSIPVKTSTLVSYACIIVPGSYKMTVLSGSVHRFEMVVSAEVA